VYYRSATSAIELRDSNPNLVGATYGDRSANTINISGNTISGEGITPQGIQINSVLYDAGGLPLTTTDQLPQIIIENNTISDIRGAGEDDYQPCEYFQDYYKEINDVVKSVGCGGPDTGIVVNGGNVVIRNNIIENSGYNNTSLLIVDQYAANVQVENNSLERVIVRSSYTLKEFQEGINMSDRANIDISFNNVEVIDKFWIKPGMLDKIGNYISIEQCFFSQGVNPEVAAIARNSYIPQLREYDQESITWTIADEYYNPYSDSATAGGLTHYNRPYFLEPNYTFNETTKELNLTEYVLKGEAGSPDADGNVAVVLGSEVGGGTITINEVLLNQLKAASVYDEYGESIV
jgi:hypothetical protein